jgi:hypothetical protein
MSGLCDGIAINVKLYAINWQRWQAAPNDGMVVEKQLHPH